MIFWVLLIAALPRWAGAQDITVSLTGGYLCSLAPKWRYMQAPMAGVDASVSWDLSGREYWHRWWHIPTFGFRANYTYIKDGIAGDRLAVTGFVQSPIWRSEKLDLGRLHPEPSPHYLYWEADAGLACYALPYELLPNAQNDFIGTMLNCQLQLGIGYRRTAADGSAWQLAAKIVHNSNGQLTQHNKGLNFVQGELGWRLAPTRREPAARQPLADIAAGYGGTLTGFHPTLFLAYAPSVVMSRHPDHNSRRYYYAHTAQIGCKLHADPCLAFGTALDVMYNYSHAELYGWAGSGYGGRAYLGLSGFVEPRWGPISLRAGAGGYLPGCTSELNDEKYYERFGLYYHFGAEGRWSAGVAMKLHKARIDYIEWALAADLF